MKDEPKMTPADHDTNTGPDKPGWSTPLKKRLALLTAYIRYGFAPKATEAMPGDKPAAMESTRAGQTAADMAGHAVPAMDAAEFEPAVSQVAGAEQPAVMKTPASEVLTPDLTSAENPDTAPAQEDTVAGDAEESEVPNTITVFLPDPTSYPTSQKPGIFPAIWTRIRILSAAVGHRLVQSARWLARSVKWLPVKKRKQRSVPFPAVPDEAFPASVYTESMSVDAPAGNWFERLKQKPLLLYGLTGGTAGLLLFLGFMGYMLASQTHRYAQKAEALRSRVAAYQNVLDHGLSSETGDFYDTLVQYEQTLADYKDYGNELDDMNSSPAFAFAIGKKQPEDLDIDDLEDDASALDARIEDAQATADDIAALENNVNAIVKTDANTVDDCLASVQALTEVPESIRSTYDSLSLPADLSTHSADIYAQLDALAVRIDANSAYFTALKSLEAEVTAFNDALDLSGSSGGDSLRARVSYLSDTYEDLAAIKSQVAALNEQPDYAVVTNKVEISALGLTGDAAKLENMSGFIEGMSSLITRSDALETALDQLDKDTAASDADRQEAEQLTSQNTDMKTDAAAIDIPGEYAESAADFIAALDQRSTALTEYSEYLKDHAACLDYQSQADKYRSDADEYYGQAFYYFMLGDGAQATYYNDLGNQASASATEYDGKTAEARQGYEAHYNTFTTLRSEYRPAMGLKDKRN
jgi:hypothetical protein